MKVRCGLRAVSLVGGLLLLGACSSVPEAKLSTPLPSSRMSAKIKLESAAKLAVVSPMKPTGERCERLKGLFAAEIQSESDGDTVALETSCTFQKGELAIVTKKSLPKGIYVVSFKRKDHPTFTGTPSILAHYDDADFNPGPDSLMDGALAMEPGQTVKGVINYDAGISVRWIKLKGKNANVSLTLLEPSNEVTVGVYHLPPNARTPHFLGALVHKKRRSFALKQDDVLVKLSARQYTSERPFSLVRADSAGGKSIKLTVVDCYKVGESASVVLLRAGEGLKVNDEVSVFGKNNSGASLALGTCQVKSIQDGTASCRIDESIPANIVEYRAEARKEGGA